MKQLLTAGLIAIVGVASAQAVAQDQLPAPTLAVPYQAGPAYADEIAPPPAMHAYPPPAMHAYPAGPPPVLFTDVKVRHPRKIHPCAVPTLVEVPDPCDPCCTVLVEICAPPCELRCVKPHGLLKRQTRFDYGEYKVDIIPRGDRLIIDYDA
jgi:hypothetical protein